MTLKSSPTALAEQLKPAVLGVRLVQAVETRFNSPGTF
jgi:hypothetical protein